MPEPVLYERYDELLFLNPQTMLMKQVFEQYDANPEQYPSIQSHPTSLPLEQDDQEQLSLQKALDDVATQIAESTQQRDSAQVEVSKLREEIVRLRGGLPTKTITLNVQ